MRKQPYDTKPPTEPGTLVPWMAYWPPLSVIAAAPIGFLGEPPAMRSGSRGWSRFTSAGGDQAGLMYLPSVRDVPVPELPAVPAPTGCRTPRPGPPTA